MIVAPYATGGASPTEIARASEAFGGVLFVVDEDDPTLAATRPILDALGPTVPYAGGVAAVRAALGGASADGVVTFADKTIGPAAELAEHLGLRYHGRETTLYCQDKLAQRTRLNAAGVGSVAIAEIAVGPAAPAPDPALFPAVIKPRRGAGSEHTVVVEDAACFRERTAPLDPTRGYVIESFLGDGPAAGEGLANYFSVETLVNGSELVHLGVCGRLPLTEPARETGSVFPLVLAPELSTEVFDLAERAIAALRVEVGFVHTEIKLTPEGPRVIELNGRLGGDINRLANLVGMPSPVTIAVSVAAGAPLPMSREATGLALRYIHQPPMSASRVRSLPPVRELAAMPAVVQARQVRRPGSPVDWRLGTPGMVLELWLHAAEERELWDNYRVVRAVLDATVTWD